MKIVEMGVKLRGVYFATVGYCCVIFRKIWMGIKGRWDYVRAKVKTFSGAVYFLALALSTIVAIYLLIIPSTVWALTVLAVPPIAVILRQVVGEREKVVWVVVSVLLVVGVYRGLTKDKKDQEANQREIARSFQRIGDQLSDATGKLGDIAELENETLTTVTSGLKDTMNTLTGGNSFCYLDIFPVMPEKNAVNHAALMGVTRVGKYPLHGITMILNDGVRYSEVSHSAFPQGHIPTSDEVMTMWARATEASTMRQSIPDFATPDRPVNGVYHLSGEGRESFSISFSAVNGSWLERLELRRLGSDRWVKAMWVEAPANPYYVRIDKDYPRKANGEPDVSWPRLAKTGAPAWGKPRH